jgi:hypothetical protein
MLKEMIKPARRPKNTSRVPKKICGLQRVSSDRRKIRLDGKD